MGVKIAMLLVRAKVITDIDHAHGHRIAGMPQSCRPLYNCGGLGVFTASSNSNITWINAYVALTGSDTSVASTLNVPSDVSASGSYLSFNVSLIYTTYS